MKREPPPTPPPRPPKKPVTPRSDPGEASREIPSGEVYDLGSTSGEASDESEREAALRDLVELEGSRGQGDDGDAPVIKITTDEASDEAEREAALRDVVQLKQGPSEGPEDPPPDFVISTSDVESVDPESVLREVVALGPERRDESDDAIPVIEITEAEGVDEVAKAEVIREIVKLGADRPSSLRRKPAVSMELPTGEAADEEEKARAILDAVQHAIKVTREVAAAKPMKSYRSRPIILAAIAIPCLVIGIYTRVARPDWVYGPDPERRPAAQREAHLRYAMFLVAQKVFAYRDARRGFLPSTLPEVGEEWPGIQYQLISNTEFELRGVDETGVSVIFRSGQDPRVLFEPGRAHLRSLAP